MTVCAAVLAYVEAALTACGRTPGQTLVSVGGIVVDDCCIGLLQVAPERVYRTAGFPIEATTDEVCRKGLLAVDVVVRLDTCAPVLDAKGRAPSIESQEATFTTVLQDAAIVWGAVSSDDILGDDYGEPAWSRANVTQIFNGPDGGCIGSETRLSIGLPYALWCPPCEAPG